MRDDKNVQAVLDLFPLLRRLTAGYDDMSTALFMRGAVTVGERQPEDRKFFAAADEMEKILQKLLCDTVSDSVISGVCKETV